jgi:hypothetical protein
VFLEQIERRLAVVAAEAKVKKKMREAPAPGSFKTIGIRVDAETYAKLLALMQREGIKQVKVAALEAIRRGLP